MVSGNLKSVAFIAAVLVAAYIALGVPGAFFSQGEIKAVSQVVSPISGKPAFLVDMLVGNTGASGGTVEVSKSLNPNWNSDTNVLLGIVRGDDSYVYTLSERQGASRYIYTYAPSAECIVNFPTPFPSCNYGGAKHDVSNNAYPYNEFRNWCNSEGGTSYDTGGALTLRWRCYKPVAKWAVGDFNQVGGYYEPKVTITAFTYAPGTRPWIDDSDFRQMAAVELSTSSPSGQLRTEDGIVLGDAKIVGMSPLFGAASALPPVVLLDAISPVQSPRQWTLVGSIDSSAGAAASDLSRDIQQAIQAGSAARHDDYALAQAYTRYNAKIEQITASSPIPTSWQSAAQSGAADTSKLNTENKLLLKNKFALPEVLAYFYLDKFQIVQAESTPSAVSCGSAGEVPSGTTYNMPVTITYASTPSGKTTSWGLSCSGAISSQSSGGANPKANPYTFTTPVQSGQGGSFSCAVTASGGGKTVSGSCSGTVAQACNVSIPAGCSLNLSRATPSNPCPVDCVVPPSTCSDGTLLGSCNFAKTKRCIQQGGQNTLVDDATCGTAPTPPQNQTQCLPVVQRPKATVVGGNYIDLIFTKIYLGGGQVVVGCETNYIGVAMLIFGIFIVLRYAGKGGRR